MSDVGKLYRDASMLAMRKKQVNRLQQENERIRNDTIEECARLADHFVLNDWSAAETAMARTLAAAIRALKGKP